MGLKATGTSILELGDGRSLTVAVRRSVRARRLAIRLLSGRGPAEQPPGDAAEPAGRADVELVLPLGVALAVGLRFLRDRRDWIVPRLRQAPESLPFQPGTDVPVLGVPHRIRHRPGGRFTIENGEILVSGDPAHLARRVTDGLKARARQELAAAVRPLAAQLGRRVAHLGIRDPRTRWGSCSGDGRLGFSWRLVMAPPSVLRYVAAHEVAHLQEMNHGPDFWAVVARLHPGYPADREWLRRHGAELHRYG